MELIIDCIKADVPTKNGRIYTKECLENAIKMMNEKIELNRLFLTIRDEEWDVQLHKIGGIVNKCELSEGMIKIDVNIENFPKSNEVKYLLNSKNYHIQPNMLGSIQNNIAKIEEINALTISRKEI